MIDASANFVDDVDVPALRESLAHIAATGFCEASVRERLGLDDIADLQMRALPIYRKEGLAQRRPLDTAIDLFLLQATIEAGELGRLLTKGDCEILRRAGILDFDQTGLARATVSLYPVGNKLFFSDHAWPQLSGIGLSAVPYDQVMFIGADSRWLARATVRRPVPTALDLCTGSGIQAILASAHARRVVAVDISARAVRCARFNALASGCNNVEVALGDLFMPVDGERFDLITANPPFVPSPVNSLGFRDGGRSGEDVQRRIVEGLARHLVPGGIAQIVTEVGERDGEPLEDRVRQWLAGAPMDIHVLRLRAHSAATYAVGHARGETPAEFLASVDAWADNLRAQGFIRVVSVLLAFQWSDPLHGSPWSRVDEGCAPRRDAGAEIDAAFAAERLTRRLGLRERIEQSRLVRMGPVMVNEARVLGGNVPPVCRATLSAQAIPVEYRLDSVELDLLDTMDNPADFSTLREIARRIDVSESTLFSSIASLIRKRLIKLQSS